MPTPKRKTPESQEHLHNWYPKNLEGTEFYCANKYQGGDCHCIKVGTQEYQRRVNEWGSYYELVRTTDGYLDHQAMAVAWREKNQPEIARIMARVRERCNVTINEFGEDVLTLKDPMPKPSFPDPINHPSLYVTGVQI